MITKQENFIRKLIREELNKLNENWYAENNSTSLTEISLKETSKLALLKDIKSVGEWLNKPIEEIKYFYKEESITMFYDTIKEMESTFYEFQDEDIRTEKIANMIKYNDKKPKAIFVKLNDSDKFIMEGRHRIVAFSWIDMKYVPVIYVQ